jgi:hypothetical protein
VEMTIDDAVARRRRSGSEKRQRTDTVNLRLLPAEASALRDLARRHGHSSVQAFIVHALKPLLLSTQADGLSALVPPTAKEIVGH